MATTAVVAGTAANMGARSAQRSAEAAQDEAAQAEAAPPADAPVDEAPPEAAESPQIQELRQLAALKDQGILTEEEFTAKKAQILGL
jgi:hypothetical protein